MGAGVQALAQDQQRAVWELAGEMREARSWDGEEGARLADLVGVYDGDTPRDERFRSARCL